MPAQKTTSGLVGKLGQKLIAAHEAHKGDDTVYSGGSELPGGIRGGLAEIVDSKFGIYAAGTAHAGEYFYYAAAIVRSPDTHEGSQVSGLRTSIGPEPMCDTPEKTGDNAKKTLQDHVDWLLNEWRKLGIDTKGIKPDQYEAVAEGLKNSKKVTKFSTRAGSTTEIVQRGGKWVVVQNGKKDLGTYATEAMAKTAWPHAGKEAMIFHEWGGLFTGNVPAGEPAVNDQTEELPPNDSAAAAPPTDGGGETTAAGGEEDLDALLACANDENDPEQSNAQDELKRIAIDAGVDEKDVLKTETWEEVIQLINDIRASVGGDTPEAPADEGFQVDQVYGYEPIDPKTKKKKAKIDVQLTAVDNEKQVVSFFKVGDKKSKWAGIAFDKLVDAL